MQRYLLVRSRGRGYALPLGSVLETMRPLPVDPVEGAPPYVRGLSLVRGAPTPVLDLGMLVEGQPSAAPTRFVTLRRELPGGPQPIALAVDEVVGLRELSEASLADLPPVLAVARDRVRHLGEVDGALVAVIEAARLLPDESLVPGSGP